MAVWMVIRVPFAWHGAHYPKDGSADHTLSGFANVIVIVSFLAQVTLLFALAYLGCVPRPVLIETHVSVFGRACELGPDCLQ